MKTLNKCSSEKLFFPIRRSESQTFCASPSLLSFTVVATPLCHIIPSHLVLVSSRSLSSGFTPSPISAPGSSSPDLSFPPILRISLCQLWGNSEGWNMETSPVDGRPVVTLTAMPHHLQLWHMTLPRLRSGLSSNGRRTFTEGAKKANHTPSPIPLLDHHMARLSCPFPPPPSYEHIAHTVFLLYKAPGNFSSYFNWLYNSHSSLI